MEAKPQHPDISAPQRRFTLSMAAISPSTRPPTRSPREYVSLWICERISPRRRNHGNSNDARPSPFPAVHTRQCDTKGAPRRRYLEYSRSCKHISGIRDRFTLEEPVGVRYRTKRNRCFPLSQVGQGTGLQAYQGNVGVYREPDRRTLRLRVARRLGSLVSLLRQ